jgi:GTP-binding protein Era
MQEAPEPHEEALRSGHVALVGRPNVGKSTLLNALIGEKLSIVTPRAQTTREAVTGILTTDTAQIAFIDTPGLLQPQYALHTAMLYAAMRALEGADLILLLLDATRPGEVPEGDPLDALKARQDRLVVAINKTDVAGSDGVKELASWTRRTLGLEARFIAAAVGGGVDILLEDLVARLPVHPFLYPRDELAVQPVRFFVAELVRETVFEEYEQEVPYAAVVRVEEYREAQDPLYVRATIYVERDSQKAIVIGQGGSRIRRLGERSREKVEAFLGRRVFLDLWVKALPGWRRKAGTLRYLGYLLPGDHGEQRAEAQEPASP